MARPGLPPGPLADEQRKVKGLRLRGYGSARPVPAPEAAPGSPGALSQDLLSPAVQRGPCSGQHPGVQSQAGPTAKAGVGGGGSWSLISVLTGPQTTTRRSLAGVTPGGAS